MSPDAVGGVRLGSDIESPPRSLDDVILADAGLDARSISSAFVDDEVSCRLEAKAEKSRSDSGH
jgi:hypothetical protein